MGDLFVEVERYAPARPGVGDGGAAADELEWKASCSYPISEYAEGAEGTEGAGGAEGEGAAGAAGAKDLYDRVFPIMKHGGLGGDPPGEVVGGFAVKFSADFSSDCEPQSSAAEEGAPDAPADRRHRSSFEMNEHRSEYDADLPMFPSIDYRADGTGAPPDGAPAGPARRSVSSLKESIMGLKQRISKKERLRRSQQQAAAAGGGAAAATPTSVFKPAAVRSSPHAPKGDGGAGTITRADIDHEVLMASVLEAGGGGGGPLDVLLQRAQSLRDAMTAAMVENEREDRMQNGKNNGMFSFL